MNKLAVTVLCVVLLVPAALAVAQDDEPILLRYKWETGQRLDWEMTGRVTGRIAMVEGPQAGQTLDINSTFSMGLFTDVLEVAADGSARTRMTFGSMNIQTTLPNGQLLSMDMDLAAGKVRVVPQQGGQVIEQDLPEALTKLFGAGFVTRVTNRGEIVEVEGAQELQAMLAKMAGPQANAFNITEAMNWIEPLLPEGPVKTGDTWVQEKPALLGLDGAATAAAPFVIQYRHDGYTMLEGVRCVKINSSIEASGIEFSTTAAPGALGLSQDVKGMSIRANMLNCLSLDDGHLVSLQGQVEQTGTMHQEGTLTVGDQNVDVNQTIAFDALTVHLQASRTP